MQTNRSLLNSIRQHLLSGQIEKATELCLDALRMAPDDGNLHYLLALCDEKSGKRDEAVERLERVIDQDRHHVDSRFDLGRMLAGRGQFREARNHLNACLDLNPGHAPARTFRARIDRVEGRRAEAISGLKTALRADEHYVPALITLAELMLEQDDLDAADEYLIRAVQAAPNSSSVYTIQARVFMARGQHTFAERCLANAVELDPDNPHVHRAIGNLMQQTGRYSHAVIALQTATQLGLRDYAVLRELAQSLARSGRLDSARQVLAEVPSSSADRQIILDLADIAVRANDAKALDELVERSATLPVEIGEWLRGLRCEIIGEFERGLTHVAPLVDNEVADFRVRARLLATRLNQRLNRHEPVAGLIEPLVADHDLDHAIHWEMARLLLESGHVKLAQRTLENLLGRKDMDENSRRHTQSLLVDVLDRAGRYNEAAERFKRAGWQPPYLGESSYLELSPEGQAAAVFELKKYRWPSVEAATARTHPLFMTGWPCSGRDLLLAALAESEAFHVLTLSEWGRRKRQLYLPVDFSWYSMVDEEQLHLMRRRYLRNGPRGGRLIEAVSVQALDLAHLARLFPGTFVINPVATENYLQLQWRLAGYRQVTGMVDAWRRDQELLQQLRSLLPLEIIDCPLEPLLTNPQGVLLELSAKLGVPFDERMPQAVERTAEMRGYRSPDHWKNYSSIATEFSSH